MKRIELTLWAIAILAETLSLIPVPGGTVFFVLSIFLLMLFYFGCSAFIFNDIKLSGLFKKESYKDIPQTHIFIGSGCGPVLSLFCLGILFKILRWPGASIYLLLPILPTLSFIIISIIKLIKRRHTAFYKRVLTRMSVFVIICIMLFRMPGLTLSKIRYRNYPAYIEVATKLSADPHNKDLMQQERDEVDKINHRPIHHLILPRPQ